MRKHTLFTLGSILIFLFGCSVEEDFMKKNQTVYQQNIKTKRITYNEFNQKTQFLRNKLVIDEMISEKMQERSSEESPDYLIYTDKITEITKDGYTSYTMLLKAPTSTNNLYYNIVFEVKNETVTVFIVKYTKSENGIFDEIITTYKTNEEFPGGGANELRMYIEDFDSSGGGGSAGTPTSTTPGGMPWTGLGGSPIYPQNCDGTVTTTYVLVPYKCASNSHWPGQSCEYLNPNHQLYNPSNGPYYELTPYYTCEPSSSGGNNNNPGNNNPGAGGATPPEDEDTEITAMIQPEECTEPLEGDLDGDCMLSPYEMCLLNNYPEEVCECVQQNESFGECQEFIEIVEEVPEAKYERYEQLLDFIETNPWGLIENCAQQNGMNTADYINLYNHTIPNECRMRLFGLGFHNQPISHGNVPCANIDYYGVEITTRPDSNNDGQPDTNAQIYQAFRNNFADFASGQKENFQFSCSIPDNPTNTGNISWEFIPLSSYDANLFVSNNPITAIFNIEAEASDVSGLSNLAADDGAIIVSGFTSNNWTISTISTPFNGTQPFSGNRQWGWFINQNGNLEIYTRAVDVARISKIFNIASGTNDECQQDTYYNIAETSWENMQQEIKQWVQSKGGQATVMPKTAVRVNKNKIVEILTTNDSIDQILSNCD